MAYPDTFYSKWGPRVLSVLRIVAAFLLIQHGAQKLFGVLMPPTPCPSLPAAVAPFSGVLLPPLPPCLPPEANAPQSHGTFKLFSLPGVAGILEFGGGLLLLLGLFTRPVAFVLSGLMAFAYFIGHGIGGSFWPILNRGELAALYSFLFLYLSVAGGGDWSLDKLLWRAGPSRLANTYGRLP